MALKFEFYEPIYKCIKKVILDGVAYDWTDLEDSDNISVTIIDGQFIKEKLNFSSFEDLKIGLILTTFMGNPYYPIDNNKYIEFINICDKLSLKTSQEVVNRNLLNFCLPHGDNILSQTIIDIKLNN